MGVGSTYASNDEVISYVWIRDFIGYIKLIDLIERVVFALLFLSQSSQSLNV